MAAADKPQQPIGMIQPLSSQRHLYIFIRVNFYPMATKSRLNPNPTSRPTLKTLQDSRILGREKIGLRNIIRATTGVVEPFGYDIDGVRNFIQNEPSLSNFRHNARELRALVGYDGARAEMLATTSYSSLHGAADDVSSHFPVNSVATGILKQPCTKQCWFDPAIPIYGDAVLISDKRFHWVLPKGKTSDVEFADLDAMLTTPRLISRRWWWGTAMVFLEEPNQSDIFKIMLARQ
jgi:hypothetical protein